MVALHDFCRESWRLFFKYAASSFNEVRRYFNRIMVMANLRVAVVSMSKEGASENVISCWTDFFKLQYWVSWFQKKRRKKMKQKMEVWMTGKLWLVMKMERKVGM